MKTIREKLSITKLVLLLLVITLIIIEIYKVIKGNDLDQLFTDVVIMVVSFYFGQKGIIYQDTDSLVDDIKEKWINEKTI